MKKEIWHDLRRMDYHAWMYIYLSFVEFSCIFFSLKHIIICLCISISTCHQHLSTVLLVKLSLAKRNYILTIIKKEKRRIYIYIYNLFYRMGQTLRGFRAISLDFFFKKKKHFFSDRYRIFINQQNNACA